MAEWLNATVLKTVKGESPSRVRIPERPPLKLQQTKIYTKFQDLILYITQAGVRLVFKLVPLKSKSFSELPAHRLQPRLSVLAQAV